MSNEIAMPTMSDEVRDYLKEILRLSGKYDQDYVIGGLQRNLDRGEQDALQAAHMSSVKIVGTMVSRERLAELELAEKTFKAKQLNIYALTEVLLHIADITNPALGPAVLYGPDCTRVHAIIQKVLADRDWVKEVE